MVFFLKLKVHHGSEISTVEWLEKEKKNLIKLEVLKTMKTKEYILRGERNARYHYRVISKSIKIGTINYKYSYYY